MKCECGERLMRYLDGKSYWCWICGRMTERIAGGSPEEEMWMWSVPVMIEEREERESCDIGNHAIGTDPDNVN